MSNLIKRSMHPSDYQLIADALGFTTIAVLLNHFLLVDPMNMANAILVISAKVASLGVSGFTIYLLWLRIKEKRKSLREGKKEE